MIRFLKFMGKARLYEAGLDNLGIELEMLGF